MLGKAAQHTAPRRSAARGETFQSACKPGSVWQVSPPRRPFICESCCQLPVATNPGGGPGDRLRARLPCTRPPLFGLAPGGVCPAATVASRAVRSYRTVSPLPAQAPAVCFLWHCPWGRPRRPLAATVSPLEPGLSSRVSPRERPPDRLEGACRVHRAGPSSDGVKPVRKDRSASRAAACPGSNSVGSDINHLELSPSEP